MGMPPSMPSETSDAADAVLSRAALVPLLMADNRIL
jgi:hypothetical protein